LNCSFLFLHFSKKFLESFADQLISSLYFPLNVSGFALSDSPAGLAAYILEKFATWTDAKGR